MIGSVEEGKLADLLIVDPDPLADISVLREKNNIKLVMKNGEIIRMTPGVTDMVDRWGVDE
jgi:imidazolonepropionase-like amidohydrolase